MRKYSRFYGELAGDYGEPVVRKADKGIVTEVRDKQFGIEVIAKPTGDKFRPGDNVFLVYATPGSDHGTHKGYDPVEKVLVDEFRHSDVGEGLSFSVLRLIDGSNEVTKALEHYRDLCKRMADGLPLIERALALLNGEE
jgi:hypothetical protein